MRLSPDHIASIRLHAAALAGYSARLTRAMHGRKVDMLVKAPNLLTLPIHHIASEEGVLL